MLVAQYISATCLGEADFAIGDDAKYSDYLRMNTPLSLEPIDLGFEEQWQLLPLFGWQAEAFRRCMQNMARLDFWSNRPAQLAKKTN